MLRHIDVGYEHVWLDGRHESKRSFGAVSGDNERALVIHDHLHDRPRVGVHRPGLVYERKEDGWRMLALKEGFSVRLISRARR